jgi:hypothetical protein
MIFLIITQCYPLSSGARPVLPMGVAPEAIAKKIRYRLKYIVFPSSSYGILVLIRQVTRQALAMVVAPEAIRRGCVATFYRLKYFPSASPFIFRGLHISSFLPLYMFQLFLSQL